MTKLLTWNMNGYFDEFGGSKWNAYLQYYYNYDVMCLQECATVPGSATNVTPPPFLGPALDDEFDWRFCSWPLYGKRNRGRPPLYIFWANTDSRVVNPKKKSKTGNEIFGKVNLAICSTIMPTNLLCVNPVKDGARPAIGFKLQLKNGTTAYVYSVHAWSRLKTQQDGGADGRALLETISTRRGQHEFWAALGDFNREAPLIFQNVAVGKYITKCPPLATTRKDRTLDYMYWSKPNPTSGEVETMLNASDHCAVEYEF